MEPLAGVASGMAVVSLSLQLIQSVDTIRTFIRNVREATKELERLASLLTRLAAILEDTRNLLELQSASENRIDGFSAPSSSVLICLQSCKISLQPLETLVQKTQKSPNASTLSQLRSDIKLGLKTKDITFLETQMQHEIGALSAALGANMNSLFVTALPILLRTKEENKPNVSCLPPSPNIADKKITNCTDDTLSSSTSVAPRFTKRTMSVDSSLNRFGVHKRKTTRYMLFSTMTDGRKTTRLGEDIISEESEYIVSSKILSLGIRWAIGFTYSRILPSISVYPVIKFFPVSIHDHFENQPIEYFQHMFSSGQIHPFTRDESGWSLLHVASWYLRPDICRLLLEYGVKSDLSTRGLSPLWLAACMPILAKEPRFELCRVFIADIEFMPIFDGPIVRTTNIHLLWWLWQEGQDRLFGERLLDFQRMLLRMSLSSMVWGEFREDWEVIKDLLKKMTSGDLMDMIESGEAGFLTLIWEYYHEEYSVLNGSEHGSKLLELLTDLGVDAHTCIPREISKMDHGVIQDPWSYIKYDKKVIFEQNEEGTWVLGWDWTFERYGDEARGLVTEWETLMTTFGYMKWPFLENGLWFDSRDLLSKDQEARFQRRMANKARKERARAGLKRPRSRMPGSWVH